MNEIAIKGIEIAILALVGWYAQRRPNSLFTRLALMKVPFIPSPTPNESEFDYLKRRSQWFFMWLIRTLVVYAAVWYLLNGLMDSSLVVGLALMLILPVLSLFCFVRSAVWYVKALLCKRRNIRKVFLAPEGRFVIDEIRDTYDAGPNHVI